MFQGALLRLTILDLALIMLVSFLFSAVLYQTSNGALQENLGHQMAFIQRLPYNNPNLASHAELAQALQEVADAAQQRIIYRLLELNLIILGLAGVASYMLAKHTLEPLEHAMEEQTRFAADASHELRTPLTAVRTEIEVTLRDRSITTAELRTQLKSVLEEIERLDGLSSGLLSLARQQVGESIQKPIACDLAEVVKRGVSTVQALAEAKNIQINQHIEPISGLGLPDGLVQVIVILLDNAIKYSPPEAEINVTVCAEGKQAKIEIADKGMGITSADLPHIFDRFWRADRSRSRASATSGGYGLGLAIAKQVIERIGGNITLRSEEGKGTLAVVSVPLA